MKKIIKKITPTSLHNFIFRKKRLVKNMLSGVKCPICKSRFEIFKPFGLPIRKNAQCPNCQSLERHRLLWLYLQTKERINDFKNIRILHFAPEEIFFNYFSNNNKIEYFPVDLYPEIYKYKGQSKISRADITQIPFPQNHFDFILCNHVLEHIIDDKRAMAELYRVMKKGGFGIFQVPIDYSRESTYEDFSITDPSKREIEFGQYDHVRWYGKDYPERLKNAGFKVYEDEFVKTFNTKGLFKNGLMKNEIIYNCKK